MTNIVKKEDFNQFYKEIADHIRQARYNVLKSVNHEIIIAYWNIGKKIVREEQGGSRRANYGEQLLQRLSKKLTKDFGKGFSPGTLRNIRQFYLAYQDRICYEARSKSKKISFNINLSWTHYKMLMRESRDNVRKFYEIEAAKNNWSTPELERQMGSLLYERLAKSKNKKGLLELSKKGQIVKKPEDMLKDPLVLEFLDIPESDKLVESKLEQALINHLQKFLLALGKGFAFVSRQERLTLNGDHFYCDLVFYHTILKCYILIDLKTKVLTHSDLGQMLLYVNYFDMERKQNDDNPTIGIVLCSHQNDEVVKYLLGEKTKQIFARKYQFHLPTVKQLESFVRKEAKELKQFYKK